MYRKKKNSQQLLPSEEVIHKRYQEERKLAKLKELREKQELVLQRRRYAIMRNDNTNLYVQRYRSPKIITNWHIRLEYSSKMYKQGCHWSGKSQGNSRSGKSQGILEFVREIWNFIESQGNSRKVREI